MTTIYVLDTSVLLHDSRSLFEFGKNKVVVPLTVVEELDDKKDEMNAKGYHARQFFSFFKEHANQMISGHIPLENGGSFRVEPNHTSNDKLKEALVGNNNDNRIITVAFNLACEEKELAERDKNYKAKQVTLVTMDGGMFAKATTLREKTIEQGWEQEFDVILYENDRLGDIDQMHKGCHEVQVPAAFIAARYRDKQSVPIASSELFPFLCPSSDRPVAVLSNEGIKEELVKHDIYPLDFFKLKALENQKDSCLMMYKIEAGKPVLCLLGDVPATLGISPRNAEQIMALKVLNDPNIKIVFLIGGAGTGKTLLTLTSALSQSDSTRKEGARYKRVSMTRAVIPLGKDIGFLPGEKEEKLAPWMAPFFDNLEVILKKNRDTDEFGKLLQKYNVTIDALTYMRGRTLPDQFIIIDEVQNLTRHEVKTMLTRVGDNSKIVLMGDPNQIDNPYLDKTNNGLVYGAESMKSSDKVAVLHLVKSERSDVASLALEML